MFLSIGSGFSFTGVGTINKIEKVGIKHSSVIGKFVNEKPIKVVLPNDKFIKNPEKLVKGNDKVVNSRTATLIDKMG